MDVSAFTEQFHKLSLRTKKQEDEVDKLAKFEISILALDSVNICFQLALAAEK